MLNLNGTGNPTLLNQFIEGSVDLCLVCGPQVSNALIKAACFKVVARPFFLLKQTQNCVC
jgi:hypothetical protein